MTFGLRKITRCRLTLALLFAVLLNVSGHVYLHLADAPRQGGEAAHLSEPQHEGQNLYSSPHQCFICQSLQTQPLGKTSEFVFAFQTAPPAKQRTAALPSSVGVASPVTGRAPPQA